MIAYPQAVINWVFAQPPSGGFTIPGWHDYYSSFDRDAWASYYSETVRVNGKSYLPEEWSEYMEGPAWRVGHPILGTLLELGEHGMIKVLESARAVNHRSDCRRRVVQRFSPY